MTAKQASPEAFRARWSIIRFFIAFSVIVAIVSGRLDDGKAFAEQMHPRNRMLVKNGLIPPMKYFPEVPRITPEEALKIYNLGKAIFIGVGHDVRRVVNGWIVLDYMKFNFKRLKLKKGMLIITY